MRRITMAALCIAMTACVGANRSDDKEQTKVTPTHAPTVVDGEALSAAQNDNNIASRVANYNEMALTALENGDAAGFVKFNEQMAAWLDTLGAEDRALAERLIAEWREEHKERIDACYDTAIMLSPHQTPQTAAS